MRTGPLSVVTVVLVVLATVSVAVPVASQSDYSLEVVNSVSTPEETIELEGTEYQVNGVGVIEPGEPIEIQVSSSEQYRIFLYNTDEKSEYDEVWNADKTHVKMGTEDDALDTSNLEPGTYMLSLEPRGEGRQEVYPVVVQEFGLTVEFPETVEAGEEAEFTASIDPTEAASNVDTVDVAIWNDDSEEVTELELESDGDGMYSTTVQSGEFDEGEYNVYGGVLGEEEAQGYPAPVAVDNGATFTVVSEGTGSGDGTGGNIGGGSGNSGDLPDDNTGNESEPSNDNNSTTDPSGNETDTGNETNSTGGGDSNDENSVIDDGDNNTSSDTGQDQILEPNNESDTSGETEETDDASGIPGMFPALTLLALLIVGYRASQ
ncbi:hypothetical protein [Natrinema versiforme]|uniref:hypothetical protein n=1 Tax=Natrinema versiforme TaxID=88724 RepID=UPI000A0120A7|nr:hypothetical protein [Natrinema versiforme]